MNEHVAPEASESFWLILTPSVDQIGWRDAAHSAAREAGWLVISEHQDGVFDDGLARLIVTDDAQRAVAAGASRIAAIVAEPESAPAAVAEAHGLVAPESNWHASALLARALSLAPEHRVVTAAELAAKPREIVLFDALKLTPPISRAEFSKEPALAAAFKIYREVAASEHDAIQWSEALFDYCPKGSLNAPIPGMLDITGRPRMLVHGPYLSMPTGLWRACIRFGVDQDAAKHQYRLDWGTRTATVSEYVTPTSPGIYELMLDFDWTEVDVAEVRLILMEGSFTGALLFQGITVARINEPEESARTAA